MRSNGSRRRLAQRIHCCPSAKCASRLSNIPTQATFTLGELMVAAAAREIRDHEVVFVGMRLPLIAFVVAKRTHAPNAVGLFENGVIRTTPARELIYTMADPPNILGATQCLGMIDVFSLLQSGRVNLGFLGAAEVDRFGNLNSTKVRVSGHEFSRAATLVEAPGFSPAKQSQNIDGASAPAPGSPQAKAE